MFRLSVKVVPGSSRDEVAGWLGDELKIRVSAPPEGGKANKAVIKLLAEQLQLRPAQITLISGSTSPRKVFQMNGIELSRLKAILKHEPT